MSNICITVGIKGGKKFIDSHSAWATITSIKWFEWKISCNKIIICYVENSDSISLLERHFSWVIKRGTRCDDVIAKTSVGWRLKVMKSRWSNADKVNNLQKNEMLNLSPFKFNKTSEIFQRKAENENPLVNFPTC